MLSRIAAHSRSSLFEFVHKKSPSHEVNCTPPRTRRPSPLIGELFLLSLDRKDYRASCWNVALQLLNAAVVYSHGCVQVPNLIQDRLAGLRRD
jgi:hypothetical protein